MVEYEVIYSNRKTLCIQIEKDGRVVVRAPARCPKREIEAFLLKKQGWIAGKVAEARNRPAPRRGIPFLAGEREELKQRARARILERAAFFAGRMGVSYNRIVVKEQKTRWGSCSSKGNLNFNWRLILAPEEVLDYVVIHELAHLREMNHSPRFYAAIAQVMPEYGSWRAWLRQNGDTLWERN